jgi:hypothetical protein
MRAIVIALLAPRVTVCATIVALTVLAAPGAARAQARRDVSSTSGASQGGASLPSPPAGRGAKPAAGSTDKVREHWERGLAEHAARHYEAASAAFEACYLLDPRREFLFAWAQAARLAGDCATATTLYKKYLQVAVSAKQAEVAQTQIAACEAALAARARATPEPASERSTAIVDSPGAPAGPVAAPISEPARVSAASLQPAAPEAQPRSPWYLDLWGDVLVGSGAAALTAGTLMYVSSGRTAVSDAPTYDAYARRLAGAERMRAASVVTLSAGSALVIAGVLHMVLRDGARVEPRTRVGIGVDGTRLGLHVQRVF